MSTEDSRRLTVRERRRAMTLAHANGAIWAIGNGLASTTLIYYLADAYGAKGIAVSLILAAPQLVGLLRLGAPSLIRRLENRKAFCIGAFLASGPVLLALPLLSAPGVLPPRMAIATLVLLWSVYHLLEYLGTVAIWSWLGDLVPSRIRGRFIGRRNRWTMLGTIGGMVVTGLFSFAWRQTHEESQYWIGYAIPAGAGALFMMAAVLPLRRMPGLPITALHGATTPWRRLLRPLADPRFRRLVYFGCWFSFFNGITGAAQARYISRDFLAMPLFSMLALGVWMRFGQSAAGPFIGTLADRWGNRPIMILAQLLVASGPLFYFLASPAQPWWIVGAWTLWIGYVGLNVCLPNLMLKLSPERDSTSHIAIYYAVTGIFYGLSTIAGGVLVEQIERAAASGSAGLDRHDGFNRLFLTGWIMRSLGVIFLLRLIEPGAWSLRWIFSGNPRGQKT